MDDGFLRNKHYRLWNDWQFYYKGFWTSFEAEAPGEKFYALLTVETFHSKILEIHLFLTCYGSYNWTLEFWYLEIKYSWSYLFSDDL